LLALASASVVTTASALRAPPSRGLELARRRRRREHAGLLEGAASRRPLELGGRRSSATSVTVIPTAPGASGSAAALSVAINRHH
jgi:hypothetical protein